MKKLNTIMWGFVLVAVGVLFALRTFDVIDFNIFFDGWWTLFLIVPCFIGLFSDYDKTGNLIGLTVGIFFLLCCRGVMEFEMLWKLAVPTIIVIIGLKMIFSSVIGNHGEKIMNDMQMNGREPKNGFAAFSGSNLDFSGEIFEGAELNAVFGSVKCDLTKAIINGDCAIRASAVFGGITIYLPDNINVKVNSNSIFGGISCKNHTNSPQNTVTLYVNGSCMFGGIELK